MGEISRLQKFTYLFAIAQLIFGCAANQRLPDIDKKPSSRNTYYVDIQNGDDKNDGLNSSSAWQSLAKVSSSTFSPGDAILLRRGQVWYETLTLKSSGTAEAPITIGSFGEGSKPTLSGAVNFNSLHWSEAKPNIWAASLSADADRRPERIFVDGSPLRDQLVHATAQELKSENEWAWEKTNGGTLYFYSANSPGSNRKLIEVNVRRRGIMLGTKNFVRVKGLRSIRFREGIWLGGSGCIVENIVSNENSFTGITVVGSSNRMQNVETSNNGIDMVPGDTDAHGLGVLVEGANNEVKDFIANDNSEDGVQTGPTSGSGNRFINARMKGNRENCFDIKSGDQSIIGGTVASDAESSADCILVHKIPHRVVIEGIRASATTKGPALHVMQGASVSVEGSRLEADESSAILIGDLAGEETSILNSEIMGGGKKSGFLIDVRAGRKHVIKGNSLRLSSGTQALRVNPNAEVSFENNRVLSK